MIKKIMNKKIMIRKIMNKKIMNKKIMIIHWILNHNNKLNLNKII